MTQAPVSNTELSGRLAMSTARLEAELAARVDGEIRFDPGTKAAYAQDASNYRQVPVGVVIPGRGSRSRGRVGVPGLRCAGALPRRRDAWPGSAATRQW